MRDAASITVVQTSQSVKVVEEIVQGSGLNVLDPSCGTGTTALSAVNHGHAAATTDINPFLVWLARAKTTHYSPVAEAKEAGEAAVEMACAENDGGPRARGFPGRSQALRGEAMVVRARGVSCVISEPRSQRRRDEKARSRICRTLIKLSNDAFNHQSMSFRNPAQCKMDIDPEDGAVFLDDLAFVLAGAERNPLGDAAVILGDARNLPAYLRGRFDVVDAPPPCANVLYSRTSSLHVLA